MRRVCSVGALLKSDRSPNVSCTLLEEPSTLETSRVPIFMPVGSLPNRQSTRSFTLSKRTIQASARWYGWCWERNLLFTSMAPHTAWEENILLFETWKVCSTCFTYTTSAITHATDYGGISASRLGVLEESLRDDVVAELETLGGR